MDIEAIAIDSLSREISFNGYLQADILKGDRTPLKDGHIIIYDTKGRKNKDYLGEVKVQVKGKDVRGEDKATFKYKYSVERKYLEYFKKHGGIFFVVFIFGKDNVIITYKTLYQADCKKILDTIKKQESKKLQFNIFPSNEKEQIRLLRSIYNNCKRQTFAIDDDLFYFKDINKRNIYSLVNLTIPVTLRKDINPTVDKARELSKVENPIYLKPKLVGKPIVAEPSISRKVKLKNLKLSIKIENKLYFNDAEIVFENGKEYISISEGIRIPVLFDIRDDVENLKIVEFQFNLSNYLDEVVNEIQFLFALDKYKYIEINGEKIYFDDIALDDDFKKNNIRYLHYLKDIQVTLDKFKITKKLDLNLIEEKEEDIICFLKEGKVNKKKINITYTIDGNKVDVNNNDGIYVVDFLIGNISIATLIENRKEEKFYKIHDFFSDGIYSFIDNHKVRIYLMLDDKIINSDNFFENKNKLLTYYEEVLEKKIPILNELINQNLIVVIRNYDINYIRRKELGDFMFKIAVGLYEIYNDVISHLNLLQVKKRLDIIDKKDTDSLLIYTKSSNEEVRFASHCILENAEKANEIIEKMSNKKKKLISSLPIYNLIK